jgi:hypothetical protein
MGTRLGPSQNSNNTSGSCLSRIELQCFTYAVARVEECQHSYALSRHRLHTLNSLIVKWRSREKEGEQEDYESETDKDDGEEEEYVGEQSIKAKLGHLRMRYCNMCKGDAYFTVQYYDRK